ncbi:hypothetical protein KIL84_016356 [Mauremys mutica]|uniref:Uncharacterized protein n=1 Tax=Mauremys mutica TaxID=74926 RepID=A0A9D3X495_9SAUR|nr:hypothetical protein KIL84_016356 [Mauremys mutica]
MRCMRPSDGAFGVAAAVAALSPACNGSSQQGALVSDCMEEQLGGGVSWSQIVQWGVLFPPTPPDTAGAVAGAPTALPRETQTLINPSSLPPRFGPYDSLSDHQGLHALTSCRLKASAPPGAELPCTPASPSPSQEGAGPDGT